jgi:nucleoside-diphosphate-sugar epimerase
LRHQHVGFRQTGEGENQAGIDAEVYGDPNMHPQTEDYWGHVHPIRPRSCYDEGKHCAETLFFDYWRQYKLRIKVACIFNAYSRRRRPSVVVRSMEMPRSRTARSKTSEKRSSAPWPPTSPELPVSAGRTAC